MSSALSRNIIRRVPRLLSPRNPTLQTTETNSALAGQTTTENLVLQCSRTTESLPSNHATEQSGLYYTIPPADAAIFQHGGFPKPFAQQCSTFNETCLMIRKPAVEIIKYLQSTVDNNPPLKCVLHGRPGVGKSLVLTHVLHHAFLSKWILVHVPWVGTWLRSPKEVVNSTTRPGFVDLPVNAVKWLQHFKTQNLGLLKELDLRITNDYEWSKREFSKVGEPLSDIIELGLNRTRHSSEVIIAILREIKILSKLGNCKTFVAIDGFNAFFHPETRVRNEEKVIMPPEKVSFITAFLEITKSDWHNAAMVLTCDELSVPGHDKSSLPLYLLGINGFHHLHPFIPVEVPLMSEAEVRNMLAYYKDRRWLQNQQGDEELVFLCGGNPYQLMNICRSL